MRCIPEEPEFGDGQLAEKAVWEALRKSLPEDVVLAHSVHVRDGRAEHEIDLLVLWPGVGIAAIGEGRAGHHCRWAVVPVRSERKTQDSEPRRAVAELPARFQELA